MTIVPSSACFYFFRRHCLFLFSSYELISSSQNFFSSKLNEQVYLDSGQLLPVSSQLNMKKKFIKEYFKKLSWNSNQKKTFMLIQTHSLPVINKECSKVGHVAKNCSQMMNTKCYNCGTMGHIASKCASLNQYEQSRDRMCFRYIHLISKTGFANLTFHCLKLIN
ncbi:hypothetical protein BpHYR1_017884 [Brachionus plicatilis]|uniref:CCHC-type domain-containing protein n=1 Tax=Brachionus plicatilis TaxID=10195 RepID=A0A3M7SX66_BRAPC|nr:hypothetical protein BpHYR1_017884 [Brachionus plicatilis]